MAKAISDILFIVKNIWFDYTIVNLFFRLEELLMTALRTRSGIVNQVRCALYLKYICY